MKRPLTRRALSREAELQRLIDGWPSRPHPWVLAGAPHWFRQLPKPDHRRRFDSALGYDFEPDAIFDTPETLFVAELKLSPQGKYEALAVAEVLHHTWMLRNRGIVKKPVVPIILAPANSWIIASVAMMHTLGVPRDSIKVLSFDAFDDGKKKILWVADSFAAWGPTRDEDVPSPLREEFAYSHWYRIADEDSWFGVNASQPERPTFLETKHVEVASLEGQPGTFIACEGEYSGGWEYSTVE